MEANEFPKQLDAIYEKLTHGLQNHARGYEWRINQLAALKRMLDENQNRFASALWRDLRKSSYETTATEFSIVQSEIRLTLKKLKKWMKPRRAVTSMFNQPGQAHIVHEPLGLVLVISAWNYPINLLMVPLIGAIAGGNAVVLKPSEYAVETEKLFLELIPLYLDTSLIAILSGGPRETALILEKKFDKIFFTGSTAVGKIVQARAAVHLTPTTLELGGKSPAVVWHDADIAVTARRIAWGKFVNAGQTCIAPDYLIVHPKVQDVLIREIVMNIKKFYGENPEVSADYCRIVNEKHFDRLVRLMTGEKRIHGGGAKRDGLYFEPTLVEASPETSLMNEEIFGPILPILTIENDQEVCDFINSREKPLSLYMFSAGTTFIDFVTKQTSSGAVCINDTMVYMVMPSLPFGGVGASGMGSYHGKFSFETFTHAKSIFRKSVKFDAPFRYPPYTPFKEKLMAFFMG